MHNMMLAKQAAQTLANEGLLIESGWTELRLATLEDETRDNIALLRTAYFAGACHVFTAIITAVERDDDDGAEIVDLIGRELVAFYEYLENIVRNRQ